jgi:predicted DNA binding protein
MRAVAEPCHHGETDDDRPAAGVGAMMRARFRMALPPDLWVVAVSTAFPDATFRLLAGVPKSDRALELGEVVADDPTAAAAAIRDHEDTLAYERLHADDERAITRYETTDQRLYEFLLGASLPPEFPLAVTDGEMEFDLTATREQFEQFGAALDASGLQYDLLMAVETEADGSVLTDRQRECLTVAQRRGYFEVPRDCTLADLADDLGVDKSTASETLRRGTARVLEQFLVHRR